MKLLFSTLLAAVVVAQFTLVRAGQVPAAPATANPVNRSPRVSDFALLDQDGRQHQAFRSKSDKAVVLYTQGIGCNVVVANLPKLEELKRSYEARGIRFFLLNSTGESREALTEYARKYGVTLPILRDTDQVVMDQLDIDRTGLAVLIDSESRRVVFRGPVDDQTDFEVQKPQARQRYLASAIDALLQGAPITTPIVRSPGCLITPMTKPSAGADESGSQATMYRDRVAPILRDKCATCHRAGGAAPWAMTDHAMVRKWSAMTKEVVLAGRMPPWHADPEVGHFRFDQSLSSDERRTLVDWIDAGAPRGEGDDPLAAPAPPMPEWPLGKPDLVLELPPVDIPATGVVPYLYPSIKTNIGRDVWLRDVVMVPSNLPATHHGLAFLSSPLASGKAELSVDNWISVYSPGVTRFARGSGDAGSAETGYFLPNGSTIFFQLHYTPTGQPVRNVMRLALYFQKEPPRYQMKTLSLATAPEIPPRVADFPAQAEKRLDQDVLAYGLYPHMHYRGSRAKFTAEYPDGRREELLSVPRYHFNWQTIYYFAEPKLLPKGTLIRFTGAFDNSADNPLNPDPNQTVHYGEQSWEEMFVGYILYGAPTRD